MRRFKVLGVGFAVFASLALFVAVEIRIVHWATVWAILLGGPIVGTALGMVENQLVILLGWAGPPLIPLHPAHPGQMTGILTVFGLLLWFYSGLVTVVVATAS